MKKFALNTALVIFSILLCYGLTELFFRFSLPLLPQGLFNNQCRELRTVGQTSKKGKSPKAPYIAIIGDSYGAGQGDWFADNKFDPNSRYQASHVLQDITGKDVVSLSRAGAGNYDGGAIFAINTFKYLNDVGFSYAAPQAVVVYFYEGNDITDNLRFMERHFSPEFDTKKIFDDKHFADFDKAMEARHASGNLVRTQDRFLVANLMSRFVEGMIYSATKKLKPLEPGTRYEAVINNKSVFLPDALEVDLTGFTDRQKKLAVRFLDRALHRLAQFWPKAEKRLVYIPSPLTTYALKGGAQATNLAASRALESMVDAAARKNGFTPVAFAKALRDDARTHYLHGPKDWNHFNRAGYELLAITIAASLK